MSPRRFERELRRGLREAPVPVDPDAEDRVLELALAQHAQRRGRRRSSLPRLAASFAVAAALGAFLLTPAWAAVRDWVGGTFETGPSRMSPNGLGAIPDGGRLLVQTRAGAWVVAPDGERHLLRGYRQASWSPHGLYVVAVRDKRLQAVAPDGTPHWTVRAAATIADPRWSPSGELVAYRAGAGLRAVAGDGSEDRALDESVAPVAPAWDPAGPPDLAYVDARGALRVIDVATGRAAATATGLTRVRSLEWAEAPTAGDSGESGKGRGSAGAGGGELLEASRHQIRIRAVAVRGAATARLGHPRYLRVASGEAVRDAALSPDGRTVAVLLARHGTGRGRPIKTDLVLFSTRTGSPRRLGSVPGRFAEVAWSPRGGRLLVVWPSFDEWLFVPPRAAEGKAMTHIAQAFHLPPAAPFPTVAGWCCRARSPAEH